MAGYRRERCAISCKELLVISSIRELRVGATQSKLRLESRLGADRGNVNEDATSIRLASVIRPKRARAIMGFLMRE
jgi:hypothetical protein